MNSEIDHGRGGWVGVCVCDCLYEYNEGAKQWRGDLDYIKISLGGAGQTDGRRYGHTLRRRSASLRRRTASQPPRRSLAVVMDFCRNVE